MWGKCLNVCARAVSDSDPERVNLGWSLFQFLPRLVLTPTEHGWHSNASGAVIRRRCARFLDGEWRALWADARGRTGRRLVWRELHLAQLVAVVVRHNVVRPTAHGKRVDVLG